MSSNRPADEELPEAGEDASFDVSPEVLRQLMASGNSQLVEALQRSLNKMVGQSSGYIEGLPAPVRTRIQYLAELDGERAELHERFREEKRALEDKYEKLYTPLYDKRFEIVNGKAEAPENETEEGKAAAEAEAEAVPAGVPDFWMTALRNAMEEETINDKDAEVLSYCTDVRCKRFHGEGGDQDDEGFRLVFSFRENPYFTNSQLVKTYHVDEEDDMMLRKIETSGVSWKAGKDVTVKVLKKKPKPGAKGGGKVQTKTEAVESFFRWFTEVPEVPDEEEEEDYTQEEMEALEEEMQTDFEIAEMIKEKVIPEACGFFTGEALAEYEDDEADEDDDEDDEDDDDDDSDDEDGGYGKKKARSDGDDEDDESGEDEGEAKRMPRTAAVAKEQPQECKQQ